MVTGEKKFKTECLFTDYLKTLIKRSHLDHISPGFTTVTFFILYNVQIIAYHHFEV